ncbi:helix-turn-helix domain-containing protein [Streptomyces huiliensis]|uniref:helix-turn-helix domain-containing protein n=1 Tax=Streptomyces huiliensis TaxID=2876027 RepID=UPI001CC109DC|nr:helix-turn-helix transcriptional regulator [Streptomyces huiliensis]MBZ4322869.1 helix-turn-helix transcriptional regulator [Streptomyces huiliensis]
MPAPKRIEPTNLNEWFGEKIRLLRKARGWTQIQLGDVVRLSGSRIAQFERAEDVPPRDITVLLDRELRAGNLLLELHPFLKRPPHKKWFDDISEIEAEAQKIQTYSFVIPGLLQTREYARAILAAGTPFYDGDLEDKVETRMARQAVLDSPRRPWLRCVVDESAFYRRVCPPDVMRDQLLHLLKLMERPRVSLQVLPFDDHAMVVSVLSSCTLWTLADGRTVVHRQGIDEGEFITDPHMVTLLVNLYDQLHTTALNNEASKALIHKVLEERYP